MFHSFLLGSSDNISYFDFPSLLVFAALLPIFFITCLCFGSLFFVKSPRSEIGPQMRPIPYVTPHIRQDRAIGQYCTCHTWNMAKTHNTCGSTDVQFPSPGRSSIKGPRSQDSSFEQSTLSRFGIRMLPLKQWTEITYVCVYVAYSSVLWQNEYRLFFGRKQGQWQCLCIVRHYTRESETVEVRVMQHWSAFM